MNKKELPTGRVITLEQIKKEERERILNLIDELIKNGKKCPDCKREEYKCIEAHSLLEFKNAINEEKQ